jgi:glucan phosphoethanolaminetransferase (alkaline phosphatase superfamily)
MRIQTILLALAAVALGICTSLNYWIKISAISTNKVVLSPMGLLHTLEGKEVASQNTIYIVVFIVVAMILALYSAYLSLSANPNRMSQMLLGAVNSFVIALVIGCMFFNIFRKGMPIFDPNVQGQYQPGFYLVALALLLNMIANRFIRRDENLVRSADRMR